MPIIINVLPIIPKLETKIKVAAYARVSTGKDAMLHSLSAQVSYYSKLIQSNNQWLYVGVYADEAISGTKDNRANFQQMLDDCREGKIDMIITKSISRFARNTVTLLQIVRELKALGVDVYFEEQNIHTMSGEGELMITILASYAQEESRSSSENVKWQVKRKFENGIPTYISILGYDYVDGKLVIIPAEARVVKLIYEYYLSGLGTVLIAKRLNEAGIKNKNGNKWWKTSVRIVLTNYTYTGNLLLQKTYRENHITKKKLVNNGEHPMYHVECNHEAIIDLETFEKVQAEIKRRAEMTKRNEPNPLKGKVICNNCGKVYLRKTKHHKRVWVCGTYSMYGKSQCASKQVPDDVLCTELDIIQSITVCNDNRLIYKYNDGTEVIRVWKDKSRKDSWTQEMREKARRKAKCGR